MSKPQQAIWQVVCEVLADRNRQAGEPDPARSLFSDGVGLDSLDFATVVVRLEQRTGRDPFREGRVIRLPRTVGELFAAYDAPPAGA